MYGRRQPHATSTEPFLERFAQDGRDTVALQLRIAVVHDADGAFACSFERIEKRVQIIYVVSRHINACGVRLAIGHELAFFFRFECVHAHLQQFFRAEGVS